MMITDYTQDAPDQCPMCRTELAPDGTCEVSAEMRSSDDGLRVDIQCECGDYGAELFLEDIAASEGVLGCAPTRSTVRFDGEGYPA